MRSRYRSFIQFIQSNPNHPSLDTDAPKPDDEATEDTTTTLETRASIVVFVVVVVVRQHRARCHRETIGIIIIGIQVSIRDDADDASES